MSADASIGTSEVEGRFDWLSPERVDRLADASLRFLEESAAFARDPAAAPFPYRRTRPDDPECPLAGVPNEDVLGLLNSRNGVGKRIRDELEGLRAGSWELLRDTALVISAQYQLALRLEPEVLIDERSLPARDESGDGADGPFDPLVDPGACACYVALALLGEGGGDDSEPRTIPMDLARAITSPFLASSDGPDGLADSKTEDEPGDAPIRRRPGLRPLRCVKGPKPRDRTLLRGQLTGQEHLAKVLHQAIATGVDDQSTSWHTRRPVSHMTTLELRSDDGEAGGRAAELLRRMVLNEPKGRGAPKTRGMPERHSSAGLLAMLEAAYATVRAASDATGRDRDLCIAVSSIVQRLRATASSESRKSASDYRSSILAVDDLLLACRHLELEIDLYERRDDARSEYRWESFPLFKGTPLRGAVLDDRGHVIERAWIVDADAFEAFDDRRLAASIRVPLIDLGDAHGKDPRLSELEADFVRLVEDRVDDLVYDYQRNRERATVELEIDEGQLANLGVDRNPALTSATARRGLLARLKKACLTSEDDPKGVLRALRERYGKPGGLEPFDRGVKGRHLGKCTLAIEPILLDGNHRPGKPPLKRLKGFRLAIEGGAGRRRG